MVRRAPLGAGRRHAAAIVTAAALVAGLSASARAGVTPAFALPPPAPRPTMPTPVLATGLEIDLHLSAAGDLRVRSRLDLLAGQATTLVATMPLEGPRELRVTLDGQSLGGEVFPFVCQQQAGAGCQVLYRLGLPARAAVVETRYRLPPQPGQAVTSRYRETLEALAPAVPALQRERRGLLNRARASGVSLAGTSRWGGGLQRLCVTLRGDDLGDLRGLAPAGWLRHGAGVLSWSWDAALAPLPTLDLAFEFVPGQPASAAAALLEPLATGRPADLMLWLHLAGLRRYEGAPAAYRQALERAIHLAARAPPAQVEQDPRLDLIPDLVALILQQAGHPAARQAAQAQQATLTELASGLLLQGRPSTPVDQTRALLAQLLAPDRQRACPAGKRP